jgi:hypothetical protein
VGQGEEMAERLVTIAKYTNSMDAHLARIRLEENGIESSIMGEDSANMLPIPQIVFIELCVASEKADEARKILEAEE